LGEKAPLAAKIAVSDKKVLVSHSTDNEASQYGRSTSAEILFLQRTIGNQGFQRLLKSGSFSPGVAISLIPAAILQRQKAKSKKKAVAGKIKYLKDESFIRLKLSDANITQALSFFRGTAQGSDLEKWLIDHSVNIEVYFVGEKDEMPEGAKDAAGICLEAGRKQYEVYVLASTIKYYNEKKSSGASELKGKIVNGNPEHIAYTLFHELLHAWFQTRFPGEGTGHTDDVKPSEEAFGIKTYDEDEFDERFLERIKEYDKQVKKFKEKMKK